MNRPSISSLQREITEEEMRAWLIHFQQEMNSPSLTDHYLMRLASLLVGQAYFFSKKLPELEKMKLNFRPLDPVKSTDKQLTMVEQSKRLWIGYMGGEDKVRKIKASKPEGGSDEWTEA